ncbi:hypothetical protein BJV82DRAFT_675872 [Fennellomyces sp. T-0311]|nr:hypothetical protein BJV82DRAFT_675872 [Fennellomyces sp. T-0311]
MPPKKLIRKRRDPVLVESNSRILPGSANAPFLRSKRTRITQKENQSIIAQERNTSSSNRPVRGNPVPGTVLSTSSTAPAEPRGLLQNPSNRHTPQVNAPSTNQVDQQVRRPPNRSLQPLDQNLFDGSNSSNLQQPTSSAEIYAAILAHEQTDTDLWFELENEFPLDDTSTQRRLENDDDSLYPEMHMASSSSPQRPIATGSTTRDGGAQLRRQLPPVSSADHVLLDDDLHVPANRMRASPTPTNTTPLVIRNRRNTEVIIFSEDDTDIWDEFRGRMRRYVYLEQAFPSTNGISTDCHRIALEVAEATESGEVTYEIDPSIRKEFRRVLSATRVSAHSQVDVFLLRYTFNPEFLEPQFRNRNRNQYLYLLDFSRFARARFSQNGELMQSTVLSEMIFKVFFNRKGRGGRRLSPEPEEIPRTLIALTYTMIFFHMAEHARHPTYTDDGDQFSEDSFWHRTYHDMLYQRTPEAQSIDWEEAIAFHTVAVNRLRANDRRRNGWTTGMLVNRELRLYDMIADDEPLV